MWLFYYFNFARNYDVLKSKNPCILLNKIINFIKNETELKTVLERRTLCFSSYKSHKLKVKLWWVGARESEKRAFFVPFILSKGNFFKICTLSQCIAYWIHFQNVHTFTYQKSFYTFLLVFQIIESLHFILKKIFFHISPPVAVSGWFLKTHGQINILTNLHLSIVLPATVLITVWSRILDLRFVAWVLSIIFLSTLYIFLYYLNKRHENVTFVTRFLSFAKVSKACFFLEFHGIIAAF